MDLQLLQICPRTHGPSETFSVILAQRNFRNEPQYRSIIVATISVGIRRSIESDIIDQNSAEVVAAMA